MRQSMERTTWDSRSARASHPRRCKPPLSRCLRWRRRARGREPRRRSPGAALARRGGASRSPEGPTRRAGNGAPSYPLQSPFLVSPDVPDNQDGQEYRHLRHPKPTQGPVPDRPRKQEDGFHVEDHKQNGNDVKPYRVAPARVRSGLDAAFVRLQLGAERGRRAYQLGGENQHHREENRNDQKDDDGNITTGHATTITCCSAASQRARKQSRRASREWTALESLRQKNDAVRTHTHGVDTTLMLFSRRQRPARSACSPPRQQL